MVTTPEAADEPLNHDNKPEKILKHTNIHEDSGGNNYKLRFEELEEESEAAASGVG